MTTSEFFGKFKSGYLWGNLLAMAAVVALLVLGVKYGLKAYTHHGESLVVPSVKHKAYKDAERILDDLGLVVVVSDTGYVKTLPPNVVLEQSIESGEHVKSGRIIYLTVNASKTPTITLPDIIDNSSLREAMAKLSSMGFKLGMPQFIPGERDWVYAVLVNGKNVATGDKISVEDSLIIQVGNGMRDANDSVNYIDPIYPEEEESDEFDEFETVEPEQPAEQQTQQSTQQSTTTE
ncbi:MAG: PASTA domain-containing protein [Prevotella sp.]|nr:PASTA domain-containing protein [Prevotella sp.]